MTDDFDFQEKFAIIEAKLDMIIKYMRPESLRKQMVEELEYKIKSIKNEAWEKRMGEDL